MNIARPSDPGHLPRRLWWTLAGLTLAWGFNWTAIKVALAGVSPLTFRTLCLAVGSAVLFSVVRAGGHSLAVPKGQWRRLALLIAAKETINSVAHRQHHPEHWHSSSKQHQT